MITDTDAQQLLTILDEASNLLVALFASLEQEYDALVKKNSDKLEEQTQKKALICAKLEAVDERRNLLFKQHQLSDNKESISAFISSADEKWQPLLTDSFAKFSQLLSDTRDKNIINGMIIHQNREQFMRLISILKGENKTASTTYSKAGKLAD